MIKQAVILCAGKGTRLGIVTSHKAKPLVEVADKPFITYLIDDLVEVGVKDIVLLVGYLKDQFNFLREIYPEVRLVESNISVNKGVLGIPNLDYKFLVANGDCYPIFKESESFADFLDGTRRPSLGVKEVGTESIRELKDCGLAVVDRDSVEMGLLNCGRFSSMIGLLKSFVLEGNLHIGDPEGLEGAETWLSGNTSTVSSQSHILVTS